LRRDGCARRGVDGKSLGGFGRGVLGNHSINLKDGWFKGQRVQCRVDVEETVRFYAEMLKNEHGRQTISTYSFCLFWCCPVGEGINVFCDGEYRRYVALNFRLVGMV
jgi:hypothetical protein